MKVALGNSATEVCSGLVLAYITSLCSFVHYINTESLSGHSFALSHLKLVLDSYFIDPGK